MKAEVVEERQILEVPVNVLETGLAAARLEDDGLGLNTAQSLEALQLWRNGQPLVGTVRVEVAEGMPVVITPERTLTLAVGEYRGNRENPEALYGFLDAFWKNFGAELTRRGRNLAPVDLQLTDCPYTAEELYRFRQQPVPDMGFFMPAKLADREGLPILQAGFPQMSIYVQEGGEYVHKTSRWIYTESGLFTPNHGTTQKEAERILGGRSRLGLTPNIFIALSGLIKIVDGRFIDEKSVSRLLGFLIKGEAASARFNSVGFCSVRWLWNPGARSQYLGARSLGVKS